MPERILLRALASGVGTASVDAASNFFASSITFTGANDIGVGANGYLWVEFMSATANILSVHMDDGSQSVKGQLINKEAATGYCSAATMYHFDVNIDQRMAYNFRLSTEGTVTICNVYYVPFGA